MGHLFSSNSLKWSEGYSKGFEIGFGEGNICGKEMTSQIFQQSSYQKGFQEGSNAGSKSGYEDGHALGLSKGTAVGFYEGLKTTPNYQKGYTLGFNRSLKTVFPSLLGSLAIIGTLYFINRKFSQKSERVSKIPKDIRFPKIETKSMVNDWRAIFQQTLNNEIGMDGTIQIKIYISKANESSPNFKVILAHRDILRFRCHYFDQILSKNHNIETIDFHEFEDLGDSTPGFLEFLKWLYCGEIDFSINSETMLQMIRWGKLFESNIYLKQCEAGLCEILTNENLGKLINIGKQFEFSELLLQCEKLLEGHPVDVLVEKVFQEIMGPNDESE